MFPHGLMFHHFFNAQHPKGQGAIDATTFNRVLDLYGNRIRSAHEWTDRAIEGSLSDTDVCLTFDDALKCQVDVALPILEARGLTAFWFVYSSVFEGNVETLEIFRYFRTTEFESFEQYCDAFMDAAQVRFSNKLVVGLKNADIGGYLSEFPFYSYQDRLYRFVRDRILTTSEHEACHWRMMQAKHFDIDAARANLWMTDGDIRTLSANGHCVGLHSYSHPIRIETLPIEEQRLEYEKNFTHLHATTNSRPRVMSHPCNSYNTETIAILKELGIEIGFCSNLSKGRAKSSLEIPREDHSNIVATMR